jgi:SAM-dependent methyltransferase|tara:strand:+ start:448 stop:1089 length:642 start_codon:yes stop_codon:yes gene_type:complete
MLKTLRDFSYSLLPVQYRFSRIYKKNRWGSDESKSGDGSTLRNTKNLRDFLTMIILDQKITSIVDIACGDFNWMKDIVQNNKIKYLGIDIVPNVIEENQRKYGSKRVEFKIANVIKEVPPEADLAIFRDCILHLSFSDGLSALKNIRSSGSPFVLMSTWSGKSENLDIPSGRFRPVDLCSPPFSLPEPAQIIKENEPGKYAGLWATSGWSKET